jgi:hypothetical protein
VLAAIADGVAQKPNLPTTREAMGPYVEERFWKPEYLPFVGG